MTSPLITPAVQEAARTLRAGGLVAYPTEAVFGLGCDPRNEDALARLLALKQRPAEKGLILIAAAAVQLDDWVQPLPEQAQATVLASWPGPHTWLIPARRGVSALLRGAHDSLAVRVTDHPLAAALCRAFGGPVVSTSANPSGREPARDAARLRDLFGDAIDCYLDGPLGGRDRPSEIREALTGALLRS
ncbi:L-threonylcarbamoyladenylate synthase [Acidihalobacter ferrooxydans]|uniref:Threonylcarbamoyl-AMP synthase n=1 Tax=Acidihalobacter ferrooxydans TaxID=1765967 RepID=A0A1P8UKQ2_9GAMM|nr:L-threonylcarbamoyladenylate synthase [Acidihalobacter ferrooxydans]APZ44362.1 threonylcarbamoyl-AMP synthase [Acidihalobacter ferrooxydans]